MSETQALLGKIAALRQRLEQDKGREAGKNTSAPVDEVPPGLARLWELERQVSAGAEQTQSLDKLVRPTPASRPLPSQLTTRARKVLEKGRELLQALKAFPPDPALHESGGPLADLYRETTILAETAMRMVIQSPDAPGSQLRECAGIEALLGSAFQRLASLSQAHRLHGEEQRRLGLLGDCLDRLESGADVDLTPMTELAELLLCEAAESAPLRFYHPPVPSADRAWVVRFAACHGLTTAAVMARLARHEPEVRNRAADAVLAALLHDVGMLRVPPEVLAHPGPLDEEGRRAVEPHGPAGGSIIERLPSAPGWLIEAAVHHHERLDGTGYPDGRKEGQLASLTRLLAVCDVYAAGCQARPHRAPRDTRTALTDALLLAEQGKLDRHFAERLLHLSFYPVGAVIEMADGALAAVVAVASGSMDLNAPARPVVALLTDAQGRFLPSPRYLDLGHSDSHSIVRTLSPGERRRHLGTRYPEWAL